MFNILLALTAGILIGWNFHSFFMALNPPQILKNDFNLSLKPVIAKVESNQSVEENRSVKIEVTPTTIPITFNSLLKKNLFLNALEIYKESNKSKQALYRKGLESFFQEKIPLNVKESISQLNEYQNIESNNMKTKQQLIEAYQLIDKHDKAIELLINLLNSTNNALEQEQYYKEIIKVSQIYIDRLLKNKKYQQLIAFLEKHIEYEFNTTFYTFTLAKYYLDTEEHPLAKKLLKEIEFDEEYGERAKVLLKSIESNQTIEDIHYNYKFPLIKKEEAFLIEVTIDEIPMKLMIDTQARYTLIDENKVSSYSILIENEISLETSEGNITSKLQQTQSFKIEELELTEFNVATAPFKEKGADGLLGMNFFEKFIFKIDQEQNFLYLSNKSTDNP